MEEINKLNKNRSVDKSQATAFLTPLLDINSDKKYPFYLQNGIENCYIYDDNHLVLVYELNDDTIRFDQTLDFDKDIDFVKSVDIKGQNKIGYVISIPERFKEDVQLFLEGKYSQFSDELKQNILSFWTLENNNDNELYGVLYKTESGKKYGENSKEEGDEFAEGEYWMKPDPKLEYFHNLYEEE